MKPPIRHMTALNMDRKIRTALCYPSHRAVDSRTLWTYVDLLVTCPKCRALLDAQPAAVQTAVAG